jgi:autotransporter-associated beta strand protein
MLNHLAQSVTHRVVSRLQRAFPSVPATNPFVAPVGGAEVARVEAESTVFDFLFRVTMRCPRWSMFAGLASLLSTTWASAQTVDTSFMSTNAPGWKFGGVGYEPNLTAGVVPGDTDGNGWLRMTDLSGYRATYAYYDSAVDSRDTTIYAEFQFAHWGSAGIGAADGMTFFLFDGTQSFAVGADGGSMGYAQKTGVSGLAGGYMGLALDDWGNYSNPTEGRIGGPGFISNAIAVRGPGSGTSGYEYIAGTQFNGAPALSDQMDFPSATTRPSTDAEYRRVAITLSPGNQLSVSIQFGLTNAPQSIYIADLSGYTRPETLKFGFTSGTGAAMSYHELRNFSLSSVPAMLWDNQTSDSLWATSTNWYPNNLPVSGADILFNNAFVSTNQYVNLGGAERLVRTLTMDAPFSYALTNGVIKFDGGSAPGTLTLAMSSIYGDAAQTVQANITTTADLLIKNTAESLFTLSGNITNGGYRLNFHGAGPILSSGIISGTGDLQKYGTNSLTLSGANTYSGGTWINAGALGLGNDAALSTGTLTVNGSTAELFASGTRSVSNNVSLRSNLAITGTDNLTLSGSITNYGANNTITVNNTGTTTLSGAVKLSESNTARTLTLDGTGNATISGIIENGGTGAGNLVKNGTGTLTLSGANNYTGTTTVNDGGLKLGASNVLPDSADMNLAGGTLLLNNYSDRVDLFTFANATLDYGTTPGANYFMFTDEGATPTGNLTVLNWEAGTDRLAYRSTSSVPSSTFLNNIYFSGYGAGAEVLAANQDKSISGYGGATDWDFITPKTAAWSVWDGGSGTDDQWNRGANWVGDSSPSSGTTLRVSFAGTTRTNPVMEASYTVNSLLFTNGAGSFTLTNNNVTNRRITFDGTLPSLMQKSENDQEIATRLVLNQNTIVDMIGAGDLTLSQRVSGSGGINKYGTGGTLILSAANTYSGSTIINQGVVNIRNATALGDTVGGSTVASGAALEVQGGITVSGEALNLEGSGVSNGGALRNVSGNNTWTGDVTLTGDARINSDSGTMTVSGAISGSGKDLTVGGAGNVTLSGVVGTGAGSLTYDGSGTMTLSGGSANTFTGGLFVNSGTVDLNKTAGVDAVSGAVNIGDGSGTDTLRLQASNQIQDSTILDFASSGVLNLNNFSETVAGINSTSGSAAIQLGNGTLTVNSFANSSFAGVISDGAGTGALTKTGANTLTLSGANTYDGTTTVSAGVLNIRDNAALGSSTGGTVVSSGATLQVQDSITVTGEALTLNGSGVSGTGALRNTLGNNVWTGNVTLGSASTIASDSGTLAISGGVANAGNALTVTGAGNTTLNGVVSGAGGLKKSGSGTLALGGNNTFTGSITISGGTLLLAGNDRIANTVDMTLNGGTFATGGFDETLDTLTLSANSAIDLGSGSSFLNFGDSSAMSWTGGTTLTINNWSGSASGGGTDRIYFGSSDLGLSSGQLAKVFFVDPFGPGSGTYPAGILSTGEIVPVPEPATIALVCLLVVGIGWREREKFTTLVRNWTSTRTV